MRLIIHDLSEEEIATFFPIRNADRQISAKLPHKRCVGCFGCWIKTPGQCVIKDNLCDMGKSIAEANAVIIISQCVYGCFSPQVKAVLDRCISYVHPFFTFRGGEMHHRTRYRSQKDFHMLFYGRDITPQEKETARAYCKAVGVNWNAKRVTVSFEDWKV